MAALGVIVAHGRSTDDVIRFFFFLDDAVD
jgi:hypothetical protein